jgi:hypothetical protein
MTGVFLPVCNVVSHHINVCYICYDSYFSVEILQLSEMAWGCDTI